MTTTPSTERSCCTPAALAATSGRTCPGVALLLVLLAAIPPLIFDLGARDVGRVMENITMLSAQETWLRHHGADQIPAEEGAWLRPSSKGSLRIIKGPGVMWSYFLAWSDLTPENSTPQQLLHRARIATGVVGLMMVLATYWAGLSLGAVRGAAIAAAAMATMWFFQRQARTASYDIHLSAWVTVSIAAGFWAIRPVTGDAPSWQRVVGWVISGVTMGLAWLCKNPLALIALVPLAAAAVIAPRDRKTHLLGLAAMVVVGCLVALPWNVWVAQLADANPSAQLLKEYQASRSKGTPFYYYIGLLALVAPWSVWLVGGLFLPFVKSRVISRRAALAPWVGFVALLVVFSIPDAKQQRYILPLLPLASLLIGLTWANHARAAESGKPDEGAAVLYVPHWVGLMIAAPLIAGFFAAGDKLVEAGLLEALDMRLLPPVQAAVLGVVLLGLAVLGWRMSRRHRVIEAAILTAAYACCMTTVLWRLSDTADEPHHLFIAAAKQTAPVIAGQPAYNLVLTAFDAREFIDMEEYLYYTRRIVRDVSPAEVASRAAGGERFVVYARPTAEHDRALAAAGLNRVLDVQIEPRRAYRLWQHAPANP